MKYFSTLAALVLSVSTAWGATWTPISRTTSVSAGNSNTSAPTITETGFLTFNRTTATTSGRGSGRATLFSSVSSSQLIFNSTNGASTSLGSPMSGGSTSGDGAGRTTFRFSIGQTVRYSLAGQGFDNNLVTFTRSLKNVGTGVVLFNHSGYENVLLGNLKYEGILSPGTYELGLISSLSACCGFSGDLVRNVTFSISDYLSLELPKGPAPAIVSPGKVVPVYLNASEPELSPIDNTGVLYWRVGQTGAFTAKPMLQLSPDHYVGELPAAACGETVQYYFSAQSSGGQTFYLPSAAPAEFYSTKITTVVPGNSYNSESAAGFIAVANGATSGAWQNRVPVFGAGGQPVADYDGSGKAWVTDNRSGFDVDGGPVQLTTPVQDLSAGYAAMLSFAAWFTCDTGEDRLLVEVSADNGATWTQAASLAPLAGWKVQTIELAPLIALTNQVKVRFSTSDIGDNSTTEAGLDAIKFTLQTCTPGCVADFNLDGFVDYTDFDDFVTLFEAGSAASDTNNDGFLDFTDFDAFVASFEAGC